jgi:S-DNA-T family DNA segregation ATPase FtsK/SpoIIIE
MSVIDRAFDLSLISDGIRSALWRRLRECAGLGLIGLAFLAAVALGTWSVQDPSFSHATDAKVRNLLGVPGAVFADLMMQLVGLGAITLLLPIAVWGWRLVTHRPLRHERWRMVAWIIAIVLTAAFAACLPRTPAWPLPSGLGGVVGDRVLRLSDLFVIGAMAQPARFTTGVVAGLIGLVALLMTMGLGWHDRGEVRQAAERREQDKSERAAISLGFIGHAWLSLRARLARFVGAPPWRQRVTAAPSPLRVEPRFEPHFGDSPDDDELPPLPLDQAEGEDTRRKERKRSVPKPLARKSGGYVLPPLNLLAAPRASDRTTMSQDLIQENATALEGVLQDFGVRGEIINARPGPVVTLYELEPAPGIKSSRVIGLADDIARSMSAVSARVAVVPGRNAIGIELPNPTREKVFLRELLDDEDYANSAAKLALCLGKTIGGESVMVDLARMPHLLIAGTTGSGKSVAINTMILSLVYRLKPEQCRLIMVDPKMLELSVYDGIPHLLTPVVTDPKKAVVALKWAVREMEERYKKMSKLGVRNIDGYNARVAEAKAKGETLSRTVHTGYDRESGEAIYEEEQLDLDTLPFIVVIVDEMADLMMVAGKDIEGAVQRLAQMARAAGIHCILATQRPSVDVITGTIKANFPTRISFQVTSKIDSRTILGEMGAEQLLGQGDMLYMAGGGRISRVHGPFVSDEEVEKVVRHLKAQQMPQYLEAVTAGDEEDEDGDSEAVFDATGMGLAGDATDLYQQAVQIVLRDKKASTSYIQRRLQIGYNRAASIMERMEQEGVVGQPNHAGKREILVGGEDAEP